MERFFLLALEEVKDAIRKRRSEEHTRAVLEYKAQLKQASMSANKRGGGSSGFPEIRSTRRPAESLAGGGSSSSRAPAPLAPPTNVDLADLSPEDRERVLRLLFAKINGAQEAIVVAPPHTLDAGELEDRILGVPGSQQASSMATTLIDGSSAFGQ